jgi:hypothetical protein
VIGGRAYTRIGEGFRGMELSEIVIGVFCGELFGKLGIPGSGRVFWQNYKHGIGSFLFKELSWMAHSKSLFFWEVFEILSC